MAKFAPNSDSIAIFAFSDLARVQVWDLKNKQKIYEVTNHTDVITDICFTPLEGLVSLSSDDGSWSIHDFKNGQLLLQSRE